ncbi:MAG: hypothetical protein WC381_11355 [Kiritimatiellia bacterium]|jgi:hypothetical protein
MAMRAQPVAGQGANTSSLPKSSVDDALPLGPEDQLVMVLFPRAAWDEVMRLAADLHVGHQEVLGAALALLRARTDEDLGQR